MSGPWILASAHTATLLSLLCYLTGQPQLGSHFLALVCPTEQPGVAGGLPSPGGWKTPIDTSNCLPCPFQSGANPTSSELGRDSMHYVGVAVPPNDVITSVPVAGEWLEMKQSPAS